RPRHDMDRLLLLASVDGLVVGAAVGYFFLLDNTHLVEVRVHVDPAYRRRGVGRALAESLEARARAAGRRTLASTVHGPVNEAGAGLEFARAVGFVPANEEETKVLDLTTAPQGWSVLADEVERKRADHVVHTFVDHVPDEHVAGVCALLSAFLDEAPSGELDLERAEWTPERLRAHEEQQTAVGRRWLVALAVAPDGTACGFSELGFELGNPTRAEVGGTLVLPGHRGRRLGLGLKLATHRRLLELAPGCRVVSTTNAGVNAPMNAVNARMGYRAVERAVDVQKVL
uniref:GNAT family N-acetyltransferase n=1 Tax=Nocardioides sp. TaxID=35761 RepID=UPI003563F97A